MQALSFPCTALPGTLLFSSSLSLSSQGRSVSCSQLSPEQFPACPAQLCMWMPMTPCIFPPPEKSTFLGQDKPCVRAAQPRTALCPSLPLGLSSGRGVCGSGVHGEVLLLTSCTACSCPARAGCAGKAGQLLPCLCEGLADSAELLSGISKCQLYLNETEFPPVERVCDGWK